MSSIYIYSPSGVVRDRRTLRRAVRRLQALGYETVLDEAALQKHWRFAGDDQTRLAAVARAAASGADVALITRGGYGISRLLPHLPYKALARAAERGTRFVGFSDFTALQLALLQQKGAVTWAGPALCEGFGALEGVDEVMQAAGRGRADVHARALADGLQTLQHLDLRGVVFLLDGGYHALFVDFAHMVFSCSSARPSSVLLFS